MLGEKLLVLLNVIPEKSRKSEVTGCKDRTFLPSLFIHIDTEYFSVQFPGLLAG